MKFFVCISYIIAYGVRIYADPSRAKISSVSLSYHTQQLYHELKNGDPPARNDPATSSPTRRLHICEDIAGSRFFRSLRWLPVSPQVIHHYRAQPQYSPLFDQIFSAKTTIDSHSSHYYTNAYRRREFRTLFPAGRFEEYVFVCPLEDFANNVILTFYISKEYNVGPFGHDLYLPGRFVFGVYMGKELPNATETSYIMLAEEPARAYNADTSFNVEVYYLRLRKHIQPAESNSVDPLCRLISADTEDSHNRHRRFCVSISTSSDFVNNIRQPSLTPYACQQEAISFRTAEGREMAAGKSYHERVMPCNLISIESNEEDVQLYISRAYISNAALVYRNTDGKIYLENMSTNIAILDELNSFDFPED